MSIILIDTFPLFLEYWDKYQSAPLDSQIDAWETVYMHAWPELLAKQIENYTKEGIEWKSIARERVFPFIPQRLPYIQQAHDNLLTVCEPVLTQAQKMLEYASEVVFVIYLGIGCGAGWATSYQEKSAILFGLEAIAECGWTDPSTLSGLVAHELGHLVHFDWRRQHGATPGEGPWWTLYSEGFAQLCEHLVLGKDTWHESGYSADWLDWCQAHKSWLAAKFLELADSDEAVRPFFGSWYDLEGYRQTGYYLGHELVVELLKRYDLQKVAVLENIESTCQQILTVLA